MYRSSDVLDHPNRHPYSHLLQLKVSLKWSSQILWIRKMNKFNLLINTYFKIAKNYLGIFRF